MTTHFTCKLYNKKCCMIRTILPNALHIEVLSFVWVGNSSKSTFLHQRDLEIWDSCDLPNSPPFYPINRQESGFLLFFLQTVHPLQLQEECLQAHCIANVHCSTQFRESSLRTKTLALWVCIFFKTKWVSLNFAIKKSPNSLITFLSAS